MVGVASLLPSSNFERDRCQVLEPARQALALQEADLDFGHVKPTGTFWRIVKLSAMQERGGCLDSRFVPDQNPDCILAKEWEITQAPGYCFLSGPGFV